MSLRLIPETPQIEDTDGFSKSDIFDARESGERLAKIVGEIEGPSAIVLDGPWGSGKWTFVKQWVGLLRQRAHPVVYFDAFEHDHLDDAFFPLLGHLLRAHSTGEPALRQRLQESLITTATELAKATPRILADVGLRSATGGILDASKLREAVNDSANRSTEAKIKECIGSANLMSSCVRHFRKALADAVSEGSPDGDTKTKSLVFVIDELDRCRPSYALSILERMKHLFAVDGICFVFVTHLSALARMVRREYGLTDDNDRDYLDKFFQLRFDIRSLLFRGSERRRQRYLSHLASSIDLEWSSIHYRAIIMNNLVRVHDIPLRSQERIMLNRFLFRASESQDGGSIHPHGDRDFTYTLADCLCVMREADPSLYRNASRGELEYSDAMGFLRLEKWTEAGADFLQGIDRCWKVTAIGGREHLTEDERERVARLKLPSYVENPLVAVCAYIDQVAQ